MMARPDRSEAAPYYFTYIDQVPDGDICGMLATQVDDTQALLEAVTEEQSLHRYAPDKWSIREVVGHINDTERLFVSRAFWFARGFETPLPSFDQHVAMGASAADERALSRHLEEFRSVRAATLSFFLNLPEAAWTRRGTASGNPFTVRALAYLTVGHVIHHSRIVQSQYL